MRHHWRNALKKIQPFLMLKFHKIPIVKHNELHQFTVCKKWMFAVLMGCSTIFRGISACSMCAAWQCAKLHLAIVSWSKDFTHTHIHTRAHELPRPLTIYLDHTQLGNVCHFSHKLFYNISSNLNVFSFFTCFVSAWMNDNTLHVEHVNP